MLSAAIHQTGWLEILWTSEIPGLRHMYHTALLTTWMRATWMNYQTYLRITSVDGHGSSDGRIGHCVSLLFCQNQASMSVSKFMLPTKQRDESSCSGDTSAKTEQYISVVESSAS